MWISSYIILIAAYRIHRLDIKNEVILLHVCNDIACSLNGADELLTSLIKEGHETRPSPCLGQCERGPAVFIQKIASEDTVLFNADLPKISELQNENSEKILFIGNSFTFYWNLPLIVESMANERGHNFDIYQSTASSSSLKDHWFENYQLKSTMNILI